MDLHMYHSFVIYLLLLQWPANILAQKIDLHGHTYAHEDLQKMLEKLYKVRQPDVSLEEFESVNSLLAKFFRDPEVYDRFGVLVSEIIFQSRRSLLFDQRCEGTQYDLTNVNLPDPGTSYETYIKSRDTLLASGHFFCDPLRGLECSSTRKCDCRQESVWNSTVNKCFIPPGIYCPHDQEWVDRKERDVFFKYLKYEISEGPSYGRNIDVFKSSNVAHSSGVSSQRNFINCASPAKCTLLKYFLLPVCTETDPKDDFSKHGYFPFVTNSSFGETCKESEHRILFTPTGAQNTNSTLRRQTLNELERSRARFCDPSNLLICGSSGTCTCIGQFLHNGSQCVGPPEYFSCDDDIDFIKVFRDNTTILPIWRGEVDSARYKLVQLCGPVYSACWNQRLPNSQLGYVGACVCPGLRFAGVNCEHILSRFFQNVFYPRTSLPVDIPTLQEKREIFGQLNEVAFAFETIFKVDPLGPCKKPEKWWDIKRMVIYLKQIGIYGRNDSWTKKNYTDIIAQVKELTQLHKYNHQICNLLDHPRIICHEESCKTRPVSELLNELYIRLRGLGKSLGDACAGNFSDLNFEISENLVDYFEVEFYWAKGIFTFCNETAGLYCKKEVQYNGSGICALLPTLQNKNKQREQQTTTKRTEASESIILHPHVRAYIWGFLLITCFTLY